MPRDRFVLGAIWGSFPSLRTAGQLRLLAPRQIVRGRLRRALPSFAAGLDPWFGRASPLEEPEPQKPKHQEPEEENILHLEIGRSVCLAEGSAFALCPLSDQKHIPCAGIGQLQGSPPQKEKKKKKNAAPSHQIEQKKKKRPAGLKNLDP